MIDASDNQVQQAYSHWKKRNPTIGLNLISSDGFRVDDEYGFHHTMNVTGIQRLFKRISCRLLTNKQVILFGQILCLALHVLKIY